MESCIGDGCEVIDCPHHDDCTPEGYEPDWHEEPECVSALVEWFIHDVEFNPHYTTTLLGITLRDLVGHPQKYDDVYRQMLSE